jgi:hypothetical protein
VHEELKQMLTADDLSPTLTKDGEKRALSDVASWNHRKSASGGLLHIFLISCHRFLWKKSRHRGLLRRGKKNRHDAGGCFALGIKTDTADDLSPTLTKDGDKRALGDVASRNRREIC